MTPHAIALGVVTETWAVRASPGRRHVRAFLVGPVRINMRATHAILPWAFQNRRNADHVISVNTRPSRVRLLGESAAHGCGRGTYVVGGIWLGLRQSRGSCLDVGFFERPVRDLPLAGAEPQGWPGKRDDYGLPGTLHSGALAKFAEHLFPKCSFFVPIEAERAAEKIFASVRRVSRFEPHCRPQRLELDFQRLRLRPREPGNDRLLARLEHFLSLRSRYIQLAGRWIRLHTPIGCCPSSSTIRSTNACSFFIWVPHPKRMPKRLASILLPSGVPLRALARNQRRVFRACLGRCREGMCR